MDLIASTCHGKGRLVPPLTHTRGCQPLRGLYGSVQYDDPLEINGPLYRKIYNYYFLRSLLQIWPNILALSLGLFEGNWIYTYKPLDWK